jgi:hypothetical protein
MNIQTLIDELEKKKLEHPNAEVYINGEIIEPSEIVSMEIRPGGNVEIWVREMP